ncbi:hypothetical protein D9758_002373 [Tetrapyrgos nigripes]|uniref:Uncharacterized protein n=1 Tax=Tetrapyrgos nigripes TaxID=182062 RepID=A0A8H5GNN9_9AGAR|nr:hypothetical protein D9758_002373 [Tetrapyrgos nigripes]
MLVERYHKLSEDVMETLFEELEIVLDDLGKPSYEVEYSLERRPDTQAWGAWDICHQQAASEQADMVVLSRKRYDYSELDGHWRYSRNNESLSELLNEELSKTLETSVELDLRPKD